MENDKQFQKDVQKVFKREGGYHDGTGDKGGPTKYGISKKAYPNEDIENLTPERAKYHYYNDYCLKPRICELEDELRGDVMDNAINQGPTQAALNLQRTVGAYPDGHIEPETITKANNMFNNNPDETRSKLQKEINGIYNKICDNDPEYCKDKKNGWGNRYQNGF